MGAKPRKRNWRWVTRDHEGSYGYIDVHAGIKKPVPLSPSTTFGRRQFSKESQYFEIDDKTFKAIAGFVPEPGYCARMVITIVPLGGGKATAK